MLRSRIWSDLYGINNLLHETELCHLMHKHALFVLLY